MTSLAGSLRRLLRPLERTPLHPQWLVLGHRNAIHSLVRQQARGLLLDVGCGNGQLRAVVPDSVRYLGLDYPPTRALGYLGQADMHGDASRLPLADATVDTFCLFDVLEHLESPNAALDEAARVLKTEGTLLLHTPFAYPIHDAPHDYQRWTGQGLALALESRGLTVELLAEDSAPLTTSAALFSMALADAIVTTLSRPGPAILLVPLAGLLIPVVNLVGVALDRLLPGSRFLTYGYLVTARKGGPSNASLQKRRS